MDDLYFLFSYDTRYKEEITKSRALKSKLNFLKNCYYPSWNLKEVQTNTFLSSQVIWNNGKINFCWDNKNKECIKNNGTQKIIRFIHAKSCTSLAIKHNIIYSQNNKVIR